MSGSIADIVDRYDPNQPLTHASTIPAPWYVDPRIADLERKTVFSLSWQMAGRTGQVRDAGRYLTAEIAGEPIVVVRGDDGILRAFFNVCRHHAAAVMTEAEGHARHLQCPYHGWTYALDGSLVATPQFAGVRDFDPAKNGLAPLAVTTWEEWVFVRLAGGDASLSGVVSPSLTEHTRPLRFSTLRWMERRSYLLDCNWKVFVDNYLDGGYHVAHLHKGLDSVLAPGRYRIEAGDRFCVQSSPLAAATSAAADARTASVRSGDCAYYFWLYPNFMINWYQGVMDTNLVVPRGSDRTEVIFDYFFADVADESRSRNRASIAVSETIQAEDAAICNSVQRGLRSRSYNAGRLSVRREAGEHLFHRLLHADLSARGGVTG